MAVTQILAIYATKSLLLQRIYIPHADDSENGQQHVAKGESTVLLPLSMYAEGGPQAVQAAIGQPLISGHCVVVDHNNQIIDHIHADPELYSDPRGRVIHHSDWVKGP